MDIFLELTTEANKSDSFKSRSTIFGEKIITVYPISLPDALLRTSGNRCLTWLFPADISDSYFLDKKGVCIFESQTEWRL